MYIAVWVGHVRYVAVREAFGLSSLKYWGVKLGWVRKVEEECSVSAVLLASGIIHNGGKQSRD